MAFNSTNVRLFCAAVMFLGGIALVMYGIVTHDTSVITGGGGLVGTSGLTAWAESNVASKIASPDAPAIPVAAPEPPAPAVPAA